MLKLLKCLPSELNTQSPSDVWRLLEAYGDGGDADTADDIPEEYKFFYGL